MYSTDYELLELSREARDRVIREVAGTRRARAARPACSRISCRILGLALDALCCVATVPTAR